MGATDWGLVVLAAVCPLLLGGATAETQLCVQALAIAICGAIAWNSVRRDEPGGTPAVAIAAMSITLWTLIQAVPLPCSWSSYLDPARARLRDIVVSVADLEVTYCAISAAPGATLANAGLAATLALVLMAAFVTSRRGASKSILIAVALSAMSMAVVTLAHTALDADKVFGVYEPKYAKPRLLLAPLLNENHLAGLMVLGWPACAALALEDRRKPALAVAWGLGCVLVFLTGTLSLSRGGLAALLFASVAFMGLSLAQRRLRRVRSSTLAALVTFGIGIELAAVLAYDEVSSEWQETSEISVSKLRLIYGLGRLTLEHPLLGIGRGALADVSAPLLPLNVRASFVENLPVHWAVEWGVPATLVLLGIVLLSLFARRPKGNVELALLIGVCALGAQNLVDFSLEMPGIAVVAAMAVGGLLGRPGWKRNEAPATRARIRQTTATKAALATAMLVVPITSPWLTLWSRATHERKLRELAESDPRAALAHLQVALRDYPFEPSFVLLGAAAAVNARTPDAGRWINLSMQLTPWWSAPHALTSLILERRGAVSQAALELGFAVSASPSMLSHTACEFVKRHPSAELALTVASTNPATREASLTGILGCLEVRRCPAAAETVARAILEEYPRSTAAHVAYATAAAVRGERGLYLERAQKMRKILPASPEAIALYVNALTDNGEATTAMAEIEEASLPLRRSTIVLQAAARAAVALKDRARLLEVVEKELRSADQRPTTRSAVHSRASAHLAQLGDWPGAAAQAQAAYEISGDPTQLEQVHTLALKANLLQVALRTGAELCHLRHRGTKYCGRVASP
jgi:hypothetical protein